MRNEFAGSLKLSKFVKTCVYDYGVIKSFVLHNRISGETIKLEPRALFLLKLLNKNKALIGDQIHKEWADSIDKLKKHGALTDRSQKQEMEELLHYIPFRREGILYWKDKRGYVSICTALPQRYFTSAEKTKFVKLDKLSSQLFLMCNGTTRLRELLNKLAIAKQKEFLLKSPLINSNLELLYFKNTNKKNKKIYASGNKIPCSVKHKKSLTYLSQNNSHVNNNSYHKHDITHAKYQFENSEITVSHSFRNKSEAFWGKSYGGAFFIAVRRVLNEKKMRAVLEVGGGTGLFAKEFLREAKDKEIKYDILDLSPVLCRSQKKQLRKIENKIGHIQTDAQRFVRKSYYDVILSNEVIADFLTTRLEKEKKDLDRYSKASWGMIKKYNISVSDAPSVFYFNYGAILFLEKVFSNLKEGGMAFISEYGFLSSYPVATYHLDHYEYSIHWGHLLAAAKRMGFRFSEVEDLSSFLNFNYGAEAFSGNTTVLKAVLKRFEKDVEYEVLFKNKIKNLFKQIKIRKGVDLQGDKYLRLGEHRYWGPPMNRFKMLVLIK